VLGVPLATARQGRDEVFDARSATSNQPDLIQVATTGSPADMEALPPTDTGATSMETNGYDSCLETQVRTATPQKLQLMLIEGAIRFANETVRHWGADDAEASFESLNRCRKIVSQLLHSVRPDMSEPAKRAAAVYLFLFQTLTDIQLHRERHRMPEVLKVLESERQTWQIVCEEMPETPRWVERPSVEEVTSSGMTTFIPDTSPTDLPGCPAPPSGSFSLES
jgi:flagellar protein FliS